MGDYEKRFRFSVPAAGAWLCVLFLILPILVVVPVSFTPERYLSMPKGSISFRHYMAILDNRWLSGISDSLVVGLGATVIAVVLGTSLAVAIWRLPGRLPRFVKILALAPLIVPGIIHALAYYQALAYVGLLDTYTGLIGVHGLKAMPFVYITVSTVLIGLDQNLEQAARSLGGTQLQGLRLVILPNIKSGILSGGFLAFMTSWDEIVVALFITGRHIQTLPKLIWQSLVDNLDPAVAAFATIMVLLTIIVVIWWEIIIPLTRQKSKS